MGLLSERELYTRITPRELVTLIAFDLLEREDEKKAIDKAKAEAKKGRR